MSTVVFIVDSSVSHGYSSAGLARRLAARGMHVEYWGALRNDFDRLVETQGFTFRAIDGLWPRFHEEIRLPPEMTLLTSPLHVPELVRGFKARRRWTRALPAALDRVERSLDALLSLVQPAFVVLDPFVLAYYPLLWAKRLPTVVLSTKPLPIRDPIVPPYDSSVLPTDTPLGRARVALAWMPRILHDLELRAFKAGLQRCRAYTYLDILRHCSARTGFPLRAELVHRWLQPDLNFRSLHEWALWTPATDLPRRRPLPANAYYVGPSVDLSRAQPPSPAAPRRAKYRIYVAVGTIRARWKSNVPFLGKVLRAFGDLPNTEVILSTGDERTTKALGRPPDNFQVFDFLPQLRILADVDLVVTHAGAGT
jgi:UDP:flavonoid glycosyltransferase YjiC (YdhE family)